MVASHAGQRSGNKLATSGDSTHGYRIAPGKVARYLAQSACRAARKEGGGDGGNHALRPGWRAHHSAPAKELASVIRLAAQDGVGAVELLEEDDARQAVGEGDL